MLVQAPRPHPRAHAVGPGSGWRAHSGLRGRPGMGAKQSRDLLSEGPPAPLLFRNLVQEKPRLQVVHDEAAKSELDSPCWPRRLSVMLKEKATSDPPEKDDEHWEWVAVVNLHVGHAARNRDKGVSNRLSLTVPPKR